MSFHQRHNKCSPKNQVHKKYRKEYTECCDSGCGQGPTGPTGPSGSGLDGSTGPTGPPGSVLSSTDYYTGVIKIGDASSQQVTFYVEKIGNVVTIDIPKWVFPTLNNSDTGAFSLKLDPKYRPKTIKTYVIKVRNGNDILDLFFGLLSIGDDGDISFGVGIIPNFFSSNVIAGSNSTSVSYLTD